jgi:uncharacterized peroxidase-related enzyme
LSARGLPPEAQDHLLATLAQDHTTATLSPPDRAILDYAFKLTTTPAAVTVEDIEALRTHGFNDRAIHDICAVTAYYAFVNRIADGLGVELES